MNLPISQLMLCEVVGGSPSLVPKYENATSPPSLYFAARLARVLGMPHELRHFARPIVIDRDTEERLLAHTDGRATNGAPYALYPREECKFHKATDKGKKRVAADLADMVRDAAERKRIDLYRAAPPIGVPASRLRGILSGTWTTIGLTDAANIADLLKLDVRLEAFADDEIRALRKQPRTKTVRERVAKLD